MNWLARYVAQVKCYLPEGNRDDIAEEINSLLQEKQADREAELGHALSETETLILLQEAGHPFKMASAFAANGALVSEELFPYYKLTVKFMLIALLAAYIVTQIFYHLFDMRVTWPGFDFGDLVSIALWGFVIITVNFHFVDRYWISRKFFDNWSPATLPPLGAERASLLEASIVCFFVLAWLVILNAVPVEHSLPVLLGETGNRLHTFVLWLMIQAILTLPVYVLLMFQSLWTAGKRSVILLSDLAIAAGIIICLRIDSDGFARQISETEHLINIGLMSTIILGIWLAIILWDMLHQIRKLRSGLRNTA